MVTIKPVDESSFRKVVDMKLTGEQSHFVAPNVVSLAQAWLYYEEAKPYAIWNDETVVGFLMLDWDEGERTLGIWRLMVAPEYQKHGYGRAALECTITLARESGKFDLMHLDYVPGNDGAQALYTSLGFRENGEVEDGEVVMTLPLTDTPRVGMLTADEDDYDDFRALLDDENCAGTVLAPKLTDDARLKRALSDGEVTRFTVMGKTIGLLLDGELLVSRKHRDRLGEVQERLAK